jgi:deoxyribodipyrimidine photolyase-related protein
MEMRQELTYVTHHIQKIVAFFGAMREFHKHLQNKGCQVIYLSLDHPKNTQSLKENILWLIKELDIDKFEYQLPDESRLDQQLLTIAKELDITSESFDTEHFLTKRYDLQEFFAGKKQLIMESFYRMMRKKYDILMEGKDPLGGQWNYDQENRKKMPKGTNIPQVNSFHQEISGIVSLLKEQNISTIGRIDETNFVWPLTREDGLKQLHFFIEECLPQFGAYQDAMTTQGWSLFHSRISFALNAKLIDPMEVIQAVENTYYMQPDYAPLSAIEGFIRQILGWREYMRGIYWRNMPEYADLNFFDHQRKLPSWYWTGKTNMKCLSHSINQSLDHSYAHHIQRLMVTGNFALLSGIDPDQVDEWYLGIYIDAIEWVEITNTRGMSQFADGGIVATKPYVSSANYMHKMSHYCSECHYDYKQKVGENACPFNSFYWNFIDQHRNKLAKNRRMSMIYRVWDKNSSENKNQILQQAATYLEQMEDL